MTFSASIQRPTQDDLSQSIYIYCDGGFGNRFNALVSGLCIAEFFSLNPIIVWPVNNWCGAAYQDLFDSPANTLDRELVTFSHMKNALTFYMVEDHLGLGVEFLSPMETNDLKDVGKFLTKKPFDVFYYTALMPPCLDFPCIRKQIQNLSFKRSIVAHVESIIANQRSNDFWGIHIRKTDFGTQGVNDDNLFDLISKSLDQSFFVCSDDKQVEQRFQTLPNVWTYPKKAYVEKRVEGHWNTLTFDCSGRLYPFNVNRNAQSVRDALVDLLILSQSKIIKTSNSTFLNTALLLQSARLPTN